MDQTQPLLGLQLPTNKSRHVVWGHLHGASLSLAAADVAARHPGPVFIVTPSAASADRLERELAFFAGAGSTHRFPDYETLPYEPISAPQDLLAERLTGLYRLTQRERKVFIVDAEALRTWVRDNLAGYKTPREVVIREELPRNPTGKVLRRALIDPTSEGPAEDRS